jgi:transposase
MVREGMRGDDQQQNHIFSYLSPEARVRKDHPLRAIRAMVDEILTQLSPRFDSMYARVGRPSIAPEKLLRAQLLQMLYSIRSERLLMEEMDYNLLFRWFVGLNADDDVWDATVFTKNRDRLLEADVAKELPRDHYAELHGHAGRGQYWRGHGGIWLAESAACSVHSRYFGIGFDSEFHTVIAAQF